MCVKSLFRVSEMIEHFFPRSSGRLERDATEETLAKFYLAEILVILNEKRASSTKLLFNLICIKKKKSFLEQQKNALKRHLHYESLCALRT